MLVIVVCLSMSWLWEHNLSSLLRSFRHSSFPCTQESSTIVSLAVVNSFDKCSLQTDVRPTLEMLRNAGIKVMSLLVLGKSQPIFTFNPTPFAFLLLLLVLSRFSHHKLFKSLEVLKSPKTVN